MATNAGHMTKLQAVNEILWTTGEAPVSSLSSGLGDAAIAEDILDRVSREIQSMGWHVNTLKAYEIEPNASNEFVLPDDTLKVDTVNHKGGRKSDTPIPSAFINAVMRRSADDTQWLLYDMDNHTETWADGPSSITVDLVKLLNFADLNPALQYYIWTKAARRYQQGAMSSTALARMAERDVQEAMILAIQEDLETEDYNMLHDSHGARAIALRNNPLSGV